MSDRLANLRKKFDDIEQDLEDFLAERRRTFRYRMDDGKAIFQPEALEQFITQRKSALKSLADVYVRNLIAAPFIYSLIVPVAAIDAAASLYQAVCFRLWHLRQVKRREFVVVDRHRLPYLNWIQKLNCVYCSYTNGVLAYVSEIASRTEQYWCPIKHALRIRTPHKRYLGFIDYGDADDLQERVHDLRQQLKQEP